MDMFSFLGSQKDVTERSVEGVVGVEEKGKERGPELYTYPQLSAHSLPGFFSDSPPQLQTQLPQQEYSKSQPHLQPPPIQTHTHPYTQQRSSTLPHAQPASLRVPPTYPYWYHHHASSSASSQSSLDSPTTPSNIAWLSNGSSSSLAGGSNSQAQRQTNSNTHIRAPSMGRSLSSPASSPPTAPPPNSAPTLKASYFPPPPPSSPSTTAPPVSLPVPPASSPLTTPSTSSGRAKLYAHAPGVSGYTYASGSKSSYSLRLPGQEDVFPAHAPLSPIVEQDYLSPEKRPVSLPTSTEGSSNSPSTPTMVTPVSQMMMTPISPILVLSPATASASTPMLTPVSPNRRSALPSPLTMRELRDEDSPRPSPVFSSFLSRPLNRSHSLSSTRTQTSASGRTPTSISPPVIPPLDLRPSFPGPIPLRTPTRGSSLGSSSKDPMSPACKEPLTPLHREPAQSSKDLLSPSSAMNNGGDDDGSSFRADSFVTAPSIQINGDGKTNNRVSVLPDSAKPLELDFERDYPQSIQPLLNDDFFYFPLPPEAAHTNLPPRFRSPSHTSSYPPSYSHPFGSTHDFQPNKSLASAPAASLRSTSTTSLPVRPPSASSSFIDRRFASNNASGALFPLMRKHRESGRPSMTCIMFWLGFVAPWCWLIGGWLLGAVQSDRPRKPATVPWGASRSKHLLPLWTQGKSTVTLNSYSGLIHNGYPFVAPSVASLAPPLNSTAGLSSTPTILRPNVHKPLDPWVRRCRVAAVAGGIVIAVVFVIALAAVGHN